MSPGPAAVRLRLPFSGRWTTVRSPAHKVPSHGTDLFGETFAFDFVAVDHRGRSAGSTDWRTLLATEPPERYVGFGRPILAPAEARVVAVHDGEEDHRGRRSPLTLVPYLATQRGRLRQGFGAIGGNHVVLELVAQPGFVLLAHLQRGSLRVRAGQQVGVGQQVGACGNSGNSTEPHLHIQAMDSSSFLQARGVPILFCDYQESPRGTSEARPVAEGVPGLRTVVEPASRPGPARSSR